MKLIPLRFLLNKYENLCEAPLLSVSVRSYGQNKTIYIYMSLYGAHTKHVVIKASLIVTWMPSSNLERMKCQRDLDKSTTQFYQGRLTTAPWLVGFV